MSDGVDLEINGNTLYVANEIYHLGNIARVSKYRAQFGFQGGPLKAIWKRKAPILLIVIGAVALDRFSRPGGISHGRHHVKPLPSGTTHILGALLALLGLAVVVSIVTMLRRRGSRYILFMESAGVVNGLLASTDPVVIDDIIELIAESMRNPPATSIHKHYGNVTTNVGNTTNIGGSQFNQNAPNSIGQKTR